MTFEERLDAMELEIRKPIFRKNRGRANEVNYWVFDYPPEKSWKSAPASNGCSKRMPQATTISNSSSLIYTTTS